jgi:Domain of unknown function (DUF5664)
MQLVRCKSIGCLGHTNMNWNTDFCPDCEKELAEARNDLFGEGEQLVLELEEVEADPAGLDPHEPGAKVDAGKVRMHLITGGMARAITEVAKIATFGAKKYTDGGWTSVPDGFRRYEDAQQRHAAYRHIGEEIDQESGLSHLAHEAWNALAKLDLYLREHP